MDIRIFNENHSRVIAYVPPCDNLTCHNEAPCNNEGGNIGLQRIKFGQYTGKLCVVYWHEAWLECAFGEIISETDAFELCFERSKTHLIDQLMIDPNNDFVVDENHIVECNF